MHRRLALASGSALLGLLTLLSSWIFSNSSCTFLLSRLPTWDQEAPLPPSLERRGSSRSGKPDLSPCIGILSSTRTTSSPILMDLLYLLVYVPIESLLFVPIESLLFVPIESLFRCTPMVLIEVINSISIYINLISAV